MHDAQRYRLNATECLSAAERCEPAYRRLTLAIAASWLSLARQRAVMNELRKAHSTTVSVNPKPFQHPREAALPQRSAIKLQQPEAWTATLSSPPVLTCRSAPWSPLSTADNRQSSRS